MYHELMCSHRDCQIFVLRSYMHTLIFSIHPSMYNSANHGCAPVPIINISDTLEERKLN